MSWSTRGRPTRVADQVSIEVEDFIRLMREERSPVTVQQWLQQYLDSKLDIEMELLASYVLSMDIEEVVTGDSAVRAAISRNDAHAIMRYTISRMRRRIAKDLRDHKRGDFDAMLDAAAEVD